MIHVKEKYYMTHMTMKAMNDLLPQELFLRVHRSYIVGINAITSIGSHILEVNSVKIPLGEKYKKALAAISGRP